MLFTCWNFCYVFFFFKQKTAYEMRISDWSSDVCSSDLDQLELVVRANTHVTERELGTRRPAYHGTVAQIADDVEATRRAGAHEIVVELQGRDRKSVV